MGAAPIFYTRRRQTPVAPGQHLAFAAGKGYYAEGPAQGRPDADPYEAIIGSLPKPLGGQQITKEATGMISPLVTAATKQITDRTNAATHAIGGFSGDAAAKLAALDFGEPYARAEQGQAAVDAALRGLLSGEGAAGADALSSRLGVINDPSVAAAAGALGANGAANGATQVAQGSAALSNLLAAAAAAKNFGMKLPGIQRLAGLQQITSTQQQGQHEIGAQTTQLESQLPGIIQSLESRNDSRASTIASARQNQVARGDAISATAAKDETAVKVAKAKGAAAVATAKIKANQKATADAKPNATLSGKLGMLVDSNGMWIPGGDGRPQVLPGFKIQNGSVVKVSSGAGAAGAKPATQGEVQSFLSDLKTPDYTTVSKSDGKGSSTSTKVETGTSYSMSFKQAYKRLRAMGLDDQRARQNLQTVYPRGAQGRGWLTNEEQSALAAGKGQLSGPPGPGSITTVRTTKDAKGGEHGYLNEKQAVILRQAGLLPAGEAGRVNGLWAWYIAPGS